MSTSQLSLLWNALVKDKYFAAIDEPGENRNRNNMMGFNIYNSIKILHCVF